jgi:hypothetical protein
MDKIHRQIISALPEPDFQYPPPAVLLLYTYCRQSVFMVVLYFQTPPLSSHFTIFLIPESQRSFPIHHYNANTRNKKDTAFKKRCPKDFPINFVSYLYCYP